MAVPVLQSMISEEIQTNQQYKISKEPILSKLKYSLNFLISFE